MFLFIELFVKCCALYVGHMKLLVLYSAATESRNTEFYKITIKAYCGLPKSHLT